MITLIQEGVKSYVVPDCTKCICAEKNINNMNDCPLHKCEEKDECDPDCEYNTEDWNNSKA